MFLFFVTNMLQLFHSLFAIWFGHCNTIWPRQTSCLHSCFA